MIFPGMEQPKNRISGASRPKLVEKATGQFFILVRDDVAVNGKLYVAPIGQMTSMTSILPDDFKERFEWYVDPANRPIPVGPPEVVAGGPAGPFVPLSGGEAVEGVPIELSAAPAPLALLERARRALAIAYLDQNTDLSAQESLATAQAIETFIEQAAENTGQPEQEGPDTSSEPASAAVEAPKNKGGRPKGRKNRKKRRSPTKKPE